jgi:hypothetical protein
MIGENDRALPHHRQARRRRDGRGVSNYGYSSRPRSRRQDCEGAAFRTIRPRGSRGVAGALAGATGLGAASATI